MPNASFSRPLGPLASRRTVVRTLAAGAASLAVPGVWAQQSQAIQWVVGYPDVSSTHFVARTVANAMSAQLGQPIEIESLPGQGGALAAAKVAKAPADGRHLLTVDNGILVYNPVLQPSLPYNPEKDFATIGFMARTALLIVGSPKASFATIQELLKLPADAQAKLQYASPGPGSPHHLAMELFKLRTGFKAEHVPYRGVAAAIPDVASGKMPLQVVDVASGLQAIRSGQLRPLLSMSSFPIPQFPRLARPRDIQHAEINLFASQGLAVPRATPGEARTRLGNALQAALRDPAVGRALQEVGWEPVPGDATMMDAYIAAERAFWQPVLRQIKLAKN